MCTPVTKLFPEKTPGQFYCPLGPNQLYCTGGVTHCCETPMVMNPSMCSPLGVACPANYIDWQCTETQDCPQGQVCCAAGTLVRSMDPNCGNQANGFGGTHCALKCVANEIQMCSQTIQCPNNLTCIPFGARGSQVGGCG
jgi:hypothetical protein